MAGAGEGRDLTALPQFSHRVHSCTPSPLSITHHLATGLQDEGGGDIFATKLRPIKDAHDYEQLVASGSPVLVDFYAP